MSEAQRYQVIERIAAGGMAEVYRAESAGIEGFRKKVAIKRVLPKLSANQEFIDMFLDEARLCAYLNHSKCVQVFDIGQGAGAHFIVMEYVDGADLKAVLDHLAERGQLLSPAISCSVALQVCEGLAYAHDCRDHSGTPLNIVHRDISPHNVLMTRFGEVKLVDFGLAKASSHLTDEDEDIVKGKFGYLAPEVARGEGGNHRVDIFAAGILLWEMLAGRRLFQGESDLETFKMVRACQIPDLRQLRPDVSDDLMQVVLRALAADPKQRYQTANDFARDLSRVMSQLPAVNYQDLAVVVTDTANARARRRKAENKDQSGVLGDVIIDALHEFSNMESLLPPAQRSEPPKAPTAKDEGFVNPSDWGLDEALGDFLNENRADKPAAPPRKAPPPRRPPPPSAAARRPPPSAPPEGGPWWKKWWG